MPDPSLLLLLEMVVVDEENDDDHDDDQDDAHREGAIRHSEHILKVLLSPFRLVGSSPAEGMWSIGQF